MRAIHKSFCSSAALAFSLLSSPAWAQDLNAAVAGADEPTSRQAARVGADDIIVTAQRRAQSLNDVGITINVASAETLQRQGVTSVADLAKVVPGFSVQTNGDGTPIYSLRGINFNAQNWANSPTVSISIDEAPIPFSIMSQGAILDLERVEVLKGPQGTLYGQNATGGAINLIAAKPTDSLQYGGEIGYGRFDTLQVQGFVSGPLTDTLKARAAVSVINSGPWQYSWSRHPGADPTLYGGTLVPSPNYEQDDKNGSQRKFSGRLLLDWEPSDALKFSLNLNGYVDNSDNQQPQLVIYRPGVPAFVDPRIIPPATGPNPLVNTYSARAAEWNPNFPRDRHNTFYQAALRVDYDVTPNLQLTSLSTYSRMDIDIKTNGSGYALAIQDYHWSGNIKAFSQEIRASGKIPGSGISYIIGANYAHDTSYQVDRWYDYLNSPQQAAGFFVYDAINDQKNDTYSVFANVDWDITSELTLSAGIRYTHAKHTATSCTYDVDGDSAAFFTGAINFARSTIGLAPFSGIQQGGCFTIGPESNGFLPYADPNSFKENNVPWRLNANYKFNRDLSVYGTISRGFKAGAYPSKAAASYLTLRPVTQEELTAYEAGIKARLFDDKLSINAAGYYYDYKDKQLITYTTDPLVGLVSQNNNVPKSSVKGFDADITFRPIDALTLKSAVTYADSKVGDFPDYDVFLNPINVRGNSFNLSPKWTSVSDAELRLPISTEADAFLGGSVTYNSVTWSDLSHSEVTKIDPWTTVDVRLGVTFKTGLELMLWSKNITNKYYWNLAYANAESVLRYSNMPRTFGATVRFKN
ncbi:TonB-dependent receptor [Sphingobium chlorophenolicum]|uniref:TonB-dependent receptor n=1 Tax=Sphingobium chlorophenolicum TaxID=46429 RepID=A0A081RFE1_SPHCR|nr:TonB-dependent receptor [Sphingobium chlorophenolicum]KEQ53914.1 TonB-dependent receptor precursor [Sphingobium chlorophenolicum]